MLPDASKEVDAVDDVARRRIGVGGSSMSPDATSDTATRRTTLRGFLGAPPPPTSSAAAARVEVDVAAFARRDVDGTFRAMASVQQS